MELTTSSYLTLVGNLALVAFTVGEVVVAGMAYICRHWLLLKWFMTLYIVALIPYLIFVPESPHWLLIKHRYDELKDVLHDIANFNQRCDSKWLSLYRCVIDSHQTRKDFNRRNKTKLSFLSRAHRFLTHVPTMNKLFTSGFIGFITLLLYFKISYGLAAMDGVNPYLNIIIGAAVEATGYIVPSLMMIRYGRKPMFILFLILTIICLFFESWIYTKNVFIGILVAQLEKFAISAAIGVSYIFVPELFPTTMRATGMGFFTLLSRCGATLAPMIDASVNHDRSLVTKIDYFYIILTILCILLILLLPETRNMPLADKINYESNRN